MVSQGRPRAAIVCGGFRPDLDGVADYTMRLVEALPAAGVHPVVVTCGSGFDTRAGCRRRSR